MSVMIMVKLLIMVVYHGGSDDRSISDLGYWTVNFADGPIDFPTILLCFHGFYFILFYKICHTLE